MNILFDLVHPADVNLFKNSIVKLSGSEHKVFVVFRQRGMLEKITRSELPGFDIIKIGEHKKTLSGKIFSYLSREVACLRFFRKNKIDMIVCQGLGCGIACKILGIKILHYDDDPEYKLTYWVGKTFADIDLMPAFMPGKGPNIVKHKGFKELAYLHPDYFKPDTKALLRYQVKPAEYVFIREISNVSINYQHERVRLTDIVDHLVRKNMKVILSLENKSEAPKYTDTCIILQEPVENLHMLIYYSRFVISSGDTMAREACLMGLPCIYTGGRTMLANTEFVNLDVMFKLENPEDIFAKIDALLEPSYSDTTRTRMNEVIRTQLEDTNKAVLTQIAKLTGDNRIIKNS